MRSRHDRETRYVQAITRGFGDTARVGGKGASLYRLAELGLRVPPGFALTVEAFRATLARLGLTVVVRRLAAGLEAGRDVGALGREVSEGLRTGTLPPDVLESVQASADALWRDSPDGLIARSSATVEDSSALSFAGIFESIRITRPGELEAAIRDVWRSVFAPRALAYIRESGMRAVPEMAVVIQRFLRADRSGVMFTRFSAPGGTERILLEHVEGGCEKLVKGEVTPERLWLDPDAKGGLGGDQSLSEGHAVELARLAVSLEEAFGGPQDVEWCIYRGNVHVVQSRPITASLAQDEAAPAGQPTTEPILTGVPASAGVGTGQVHLAFNIEQALLLERGQVLVTPMTNPDMVVAMRKSAAIVTDVGGMICHAAIVSRELGLPCVVGTETATATLGARHTVTVNGWAGAVYEGLIDLRPGLAPGPPAEWEDLWSLWLEARAGHPALVPLVSSVGALEAAPDQVPEAVLIPDVDLRAGPLGLWNDLDARLPDERAGELLRYCRRVADAVAARSMTRAWILQQGVVRGAELSAAVEATADARVQMHDEDAGAPPAILHPGEWPDGRVAVPLGAALALSVGRPPAVGPPEEALRAALDTLKFFGHRPGARAAGMPDPESRRRWWQLLPEYGRYHSEFRTDEQRGDFEWLEVRPELVISALLKSLVQPGFEMVPRVMGFPGLGPMHIKWIRCRYHFRADSFAATWESIVRATWDRAYMTDLMRRVRRSYDQLEEVLVLFPDTEDELRAQPSHRLAAMITAWWPRWVEFFALCWFIQAQGDDVAYPFVEETVRDNLSRLPDPPAGLAWPGARELIAPTTPVMSGDYMGDLARLREDLLAAGLVDADSAESRLARGEHRDVARRLEAHIGKWHWMRDRDLLFEPWDTPHRVIRTALETDPHEPVRYQENLRRGLLALALHTDLAHASGRAEALQHHARFVHDLNVERENHHVLWLKYSYPLRRVIVEVERRLVDAGSLRPGDVFFLQAPELIDAARSLPTPLPDDLVIRVRNRRLGYLVEARLAPDVHGQPVDEDDYY